jgi:hypothetical protein
VLFVRSLVFDSRNSNSRVSCDSKDQETTTRMVGSTTIAARATRFYPTIDSYFYSRCFDRNVEFRFDRDCPLRPLGLGRFLFASVPVEISNPPIPRSSRSRQDFNRSLPCRSARSQVRANFSRRSTRRSRDSWTPKNLRRCDAWQARRCVEESWNVESRHSSVSDLVMSSAFLVS